MCIFPPEFFVFQMLACNFRNSKGTKTKLTIMRKSFSFSILLATMLLSLVASSQNITVTGKVTQANGEAVQSASVMVKGTNVGTITDANGGFRINVSRLPTTLVFSSVGFEAHEVVVESATSELNVTLTPATSIGQEVVVSATRTPERILQAPVTVERMNNITLRNVPAPNYYEAISNLKGVDMHTASLTFRTVTTRGFISSGNSRMNQLIDGMDNQAPGLNFAVGSVIGLTELDVDNIELLSGASSALYGSGGVNGTLLLNSKNPFTSEGVSFQIKQGIMHLQDKQRGSSPYYDWGVRWAKTINDKWAFKIASQFTKANDWEAYDYRNVRRTSVTSKVVGGDRVSDPNYDGVNVYGDETTANLQSIAQGAVITALNAIIPALPPLGGLPALPVVSWSQALQALNHPVLGPTIRGIVATTQAGFFLDGVNTGIFGSTQNVSRTGYEERHLVDYNTVNYKLTGGLHYKITPRIEASWNSYVGTGTTVYTGADRYSLKGLKMAQHKLEFKSDKWFLRGYTTQENAGDSYQATALGRLMNEASKPSTTWYPQYMFVYYQARKAGASDHMAHQQARAFADQGRYVPGTPQFEAAKNDVKSRPIPTGAKFLDRSDLWAGEGQVGLSDMLGFTNKVNVIAGAQYKQYVLNSEKTIFADSAGKLKPAEYGVYVQLKKALFNETLTLTAAGRYDKHTNFDGRFTPRVTAVFKVAPENYLRASYQTAYRFPTNQDQYINLNTVSTFLIGMIPEFQTYYRANSTNPTYTAASVGAYRAGSLADSTRLVRASFAESKPETVSSYEIGYKAAIRKFFFDAYVYYSEYQDFLERVAVVQSNNDGWGTGPSGNVNQGQIYNPGSSRNLSYLQNTDQDVNTFGWGLTAQFQMAKGYTLYGNIFSDKLVRNGNIFSGNMVTSKDRSMMSMSTFFNTPDYRYNLGIKNENIWKNIGMNFIWKYQTENFYEGTFVTGTLPAFGTLDGQLTYKVPASKTLLRVGATNILNTYHRTAYGNPSVGGLYYVSFGYNVF